MLLCLRVVCNRGYLSDVLVSPRIEPINEKEKKKHLF